MYKILFSNGIEIIHGNNIDKLAARLKGYYFRYRKECTVFDSKKQIIGGAGPLDGKWTWFCDADA